MDLLQIYQFLELYGYFSVIYVLLNDWEDTSDLIAANLDRKVPPWLNSLYLNEKLTGRIFGADAFTELLHQMNIPSRPVAYQVAPRVQSGASSSSSSFLFLMMNCFLLHLISIEEMAMLTACSHRRLTQMMTNRNPNSATSVQPIFIPNYLKKNIVSCMEDVGGVGLIKWSAGADNMVWSDIREGR